MEVETGQIKTAGRNFLGSGWGLVGCNRVRADTMPDRGDAECRGPVGSILPDRRVAIVHQLIPVVFKFLTEEIEHRPAFMTSGTPQTILPGERRNSVGGLSCAEE